MMLQTGIQGAQGNASMNTPALARARMSLIALVMAVSFVDSDGQYYATEGGMEAKALMIHDGKRFLTTSETFTGIL